MVIETEKLAKSYGPRVGVSDLSLRLPEGLIYGFIGPNGAGKTTMIRLLLGLLRPDRGTARIFGRDCWKESPRIKEEVGYMPGDLRLYPWITGNDALRIAGRARGRDLRERGVELGRRFELDLQVEARRMSRGMRQKLGLILALVHDPRLLVLDEPTSSLDPLTQARLYKHLRQAAAGGSSVFFSSHVLSEVEDLCDRVAIVRAGELVADETLEALRKQAMRSVTIRWRDGGSQGAAPAFLELRDDAPGTWTCGLSAPVPELLAWLAGKPVADLTIGPPDLDSLFRRYYERARR